MQAVRSTRPGGHMGFVGVLHDVALPGLELFFAEINMICGLAPVRRFLPELSDLTLPLEGAAAGYRAMDERGAVKVVLTP